MKLLKLFTVGLLVTVALVACGTSSNSTVGGSVAGLASGASVKLQNNGNDFLTVSANGNFTFATSLAAHATYVVSISSQPTGQTCSVTNATGTIASGGGNVTNVQVNCVAGSTNNSVVSASISGLATNETLVLLDNGVDTLSVVGNATTAAGQTITQAFPTLLSSGSNYKVTVGAQPGSQVCTVNNGVGQIPTSGSAASAIVTCQ